MRYVSTKNDSPPVSFLEAVEQGLAPDGGLYVPEVCPRLDASFLDRLSHLSMPEICSELLQMFAGEELSKAELDNLVEESITFDAPLLKLADGLYVLELFHGPTLAFKDFGVRFMARLMSHTSTYERTVLTATSGDTGAAVASAFHGLLNMKAVVLYPKGKISDFQERQIAGLGGNVTALAVSGSFDDCQRLVKQAFRDGELRSRVNLVSANSINLARLLPQVAYYFRAYGQLEESESGEIVFSVPSGNFGDICAGLMAKRMGLPVSRFVAATNANDVVPRYLLSGVYEPRGVIETISNAMDIADPSNFARILWLYGNDMAALKRDLSASAHTDEETKRAMREVYDKYGYICDPHGAVGYLALKGHIGKGRRGVFLETAHPVKFVSVVEEALGIQYEVGAEYGTIMQRELESVTMENSYEALRGVLI